MWWSQVTVVTVFVVEPRLRGVGERWDMQAHYIQCKQGEDPQVYVPAEIHGKNHKVRNEILFLQNMVAWLVEYLTECLVYSHLIIGWWGLIVDSVILWWWPWLLAASRPEEFIFTVLPRQPSGEGDEVYRRAIALTDLLWLTVRRGLSDAEAQPAEGGAEQDREAEAQDAEIDTWRGAGGDDGWRGTRM